MKFYPEYQNRKKEDEILMLKQMIFKLKALHQSHIDRTMKSDSVLKAS